MDQPEKNPSQLENILFLTSIFGTLKFVFFVGLSSLCNVIWSFNSSLSLYALKIRNHGAKHMLEIIQ